MRDLICFHLPLIFPSFLRFHLCAITQGKQTVALRCHITHIRLNVGPLCIAIRFPAMRIGLLYKVMIVQRFGKLDGLGFSDSFFLHNFHDDVSKMLPDCVCVCICVLCVFVTVFDVQLYGSECFFRRKTFAVKIIYLLWVAFAFVQFWFRRMEIFVIHCSLWVRLLFLALLHISHRFFFVFLMSWSWLLSAFFVGLFAFRSVWFQSRDFVKFKIKGVKWRYVRFLDFDLAAVVWYSTITSSGHLFGFGLIRGIQRYSNFQLFWLLYISVY